MKEFKLGIVKPEVVNAVTSVEEAVSIHPKWDTKATTYDYALLKLKTPLDFSGADSAVMPICLPTKNQEFDGEICTATGWGFTKDGGKVSKILKKVDLPIVPFEECKEDYEGLAEVDENTMVCAGYEEGGKAPCEIELHPDWNPKTINYDYALVKLETPLDFGGADSDVMPICLPTKDQQFPNLTCVGSGWGSLVQNGPDSTILQKVDLPTVPHDICKQNYANSNPVIEETMICAGYEEGGKSMCNGDSGGPLMCPRDDGLYVLAGTVSWTVVCAAKYQPSVFARTSTQLDWIESIAGETP
ncbi:plasma kallikrein-like [Ixodes scapularis]|uniref:plasma kallikrein-like n=1 Tax=Ixodes scapularis TaxID=6945 RepID=UPI001C387A9E|nr:plasma kallikrein-like [Ixodes scapularis]